MALTVFPVPPSATASAIATATADATATELERSDIAILLTDILTELKIHTVFLQQAFNLNDDPQRYRDDPEHQL